MRRFGLICFNVLLSIGGAVVYAWVVRSDGMTVDAWRRAVIDGATAGFLSGLVVGLGATIGPRPALPTKKCVYVQVGNAVSALLGALVFYLFPKLQGAVDHALDEALRERGLLRGSGIGLTIGTMVQFVQIYFKRRKSAQ